MISKFKKSFPLACRACRNESIDVYHIVGTNNHALLFVWEIFIFFLIIQKQIGNLEKPFH